MSLDALVPGAKPKLCPCFTIRQAGGNIAVQWAGNHSVMSVTTVVTVSTDSWLARRIDGALAQDANYALVFNG